jgi:hypothetical protein
MNCEKLKCVLVLKPCCMQRKLNMDLHRNLMSIHHHHQRFTS